MADLRLLVLVLTWFGYLSNGFRIISRGRPFFYQDEEGRRMEVRRTGIPIVKRQCDCYCLIAGDEASIHCCIECHVTNSACFPGSAHVTRKNGDVIKMADLTIGEEIITASLAGEVHATRVVGFLTFDPEVIARYHRLTVEGGESLTLSRSHVVFASRTNQSQDTAPVFAADVRVGHFLMVRRGKRLVPKRIIQIEIQAHKGAYVPLTSDGTLLVDDMFASSYAAFPHDLSHLFLAPLRWIPSLTAYYSPSRGDHPYVTLMKAVGDIIAPQTRYTGAADSDPGLAQGPGQYGAMVLHDTTKSSKNDCLVHLAKSHLNMDLGLQIFNSSEQLDPQSSFTAQDKSMQTSGARLT